MNIHLQNLDDNEKKVGGYILRKRNLKPKIRIMEQSRDPEKKLKGGPYSLVRLCILRLKNGS